MTTSCSSMTTSCTSILITILQKYPFDFSEKPILPFSYLHHLLLPSFSHFTLHQPCTSIPPYTAPSKIFPLFSYWRKVWTPQKFHHWILYLPPSTSIHSPRAPHKDSTTYQIFNNTINWSKGKVYCMFNFILEWKFESLMADDGGGGHFSPLKVVVVGSVTLNAIENSNALWVTEPATFFRKKTCCGFCNPQCIRNRHNMLVASGKTTLIAFIRARSLSLTITWGYTSSLKNNPLSLCNDHMKLFSRSVDNNTKAAEKVNPVDVTPTISSKGSLYFLVLYVLSINRTMLNAFNNLTESGCVQKTSLTTSESW